LSAGGFSSPYNLQKPAAQANQKWKGISNQQMT